MCAVLLSTKSSTILSFFVVGVVTIAASHLFFFSFFLDKNFAKIEPFSHSQHFVFMH